MSKQEQTDHAQGNIVAYTDSEKANHLNSCFGSCFNTSHPPFELKSPPSGNYPDELLCTESEIYDLLASLDVSKASTSGHDGISARMLKHTACSIRIAPSLTKLLISPCNQPLFHPYGRSLSWCQYLRTVQY